MTKDEFDAWSDKKAKEDASPELTNEELLLVYHVMSGLADEMDESVGDGMLDTRERIIACKLEDKLKALGVKV